MAPKQQPREPNWTDNEVRLLLDAVYNFQQSNEANQRKKTTPYWPKIYEAIKMRFQAWRRTPAQMGTKYRDLAKDYKADIQDLNHTGGRRRPPFVFKDQMDKIERTKEIAGSAYQVDTLNPDADELTELQ